MNKLDDLLECWQVANKHTKELSSHISEYKNTTQNKQGFSCWYITKEIKSLRQTRVDKC